MRVTDETDQDGHYTCTAEVDVTFKGFAERFSTHIKAYQRARKIDVSLVRGPFRRLHNTWQFDPQGEGRTRVHFFIDYEFKNPVLGLLARTNSRLAVSKIMAAFRAEADRRYGA